MSMVMKIVSYVRMGCKGVWHEEWVVGVRKGGEWWCEDVWVAVAVKRHAHDVWLQRKDEVSCERYKNKINQVKGTVCVAKVSADEKWGRKMTENFHENKMFWNKVQMMIKKG